MWPMIIVAVVMMIASVAISMSMAKNMDPTSTEGALDVPTAEEGGDIPVCFGTNLIKDGNVIWYGDPSITKIKSKGGKK